VAGNLTRINNNQITDAISGNSYVGINANTKVQSYSITSTLLANNLTYGSDLTISGNLSVTGNVTAIDSTYVTVEDPLIVLASNNSGNSVDIGYIGIRAGSNVAMVWRESEQAFVTAFTTSGIGDTTTIALTGYADLHTANANIGNLLTASSNVTVVGNVLGNLNVTGYLNSGNVTTGGFASAAGNVYGNNVFSLTDLSAAGNLYANAIPNPITTNDLSVTGQVFVDWLYGNGAPQPGAGIVASTANIYDIGEASSAFANAYFNGNVYAGNIVTGGPSGNISGANVISATTITATGNVGAGQFLFGDGYYISNINAGNVSSTKIFNGGSYANIASSDGNLVIAIGASSNIVATYYDQGVNFSTDVSATGNIFAYLDVSAGGNVNGNNVSAIGSVSAANIVDSALGMGQVVYAGASGLLSGNSGLIYDGSNLTATGTVSVGNLTSTGNVYAAYLVTPNTVVNGGVSSSGNIIAANFATSGSGGNITGANVIAATTLTATGNVYGQYLVTPNTVINGGVSTSGSITAGGNILGNYLASTVDISAGGNLYAGNILAISSGAISTGGNVTGGNVFYGTGVLSGTGNANVGNLLTGGLISAYGDILTSGNLSATGNTIGNVVIAQYDITAGGNITAGPTGNVSGANVVTPNLISNGQLAFIANASGIQFSTTGNVNMGNTFITNLAGPPVNAQDAVNKAYVDGVANGLQVKASSNVATTGNILATTGKSYTYNNGTDGVGATITFSTPGVITIDGVTLTSGMRVLIKDEPLVAPVPGGGTPSAAYNGIYTVTTAGSISAALILTRSTDDDTPALMYSAYTFIIAGGSVNGLTGWASTNTPTSSGDPIVVGTTLYYWSQFSQAGSYSAGNGLSLTGTQFNALTDGLSTYINSNNQIAVYGNITLSTPSLGNAAFDSLSLTGNGTGAITANNINGVQISGSGNILTSMNLSAAGNVSGDYAYFSSVGNTSVPFGNTDGSLGTDANLTYTYNTGVLTSHIFSADGNVIGGNILTTGIVSASGDVYSANVWANGLISASGDVYGANFWPTGNIVPTQDSIYSLGNSTSAWLSLYVSGSTIFLGNIQLKQSAANTLTVTASDGTTNAGIVVSNVSASGNISTMGNVIAGNLRTTGEVTAQGNVTGGNIFTGNIVSAGGNVIGGNVTTVGYASAAGNVYGNNVLSNVLVSAGGNVIGGNVTTVGYASAAGNVYGNNLLSNVLVSAGGNVIGGNILTGNIVSAGGNITGGNILTGNIVSAGGNVYANGFITANTSINGGVVTTGVVSALGNIQTGNYFIGDGYYISNINPGNVSSNKISSGGSYANIATGDGNLVIAIGAGSDIVATYYDQGVNFSTDVSATGNIFAYLDVSAGGNVTGGNILTNGIVSAMGDINTSGNISAAGNLAVGNTLFVDVATNTASFGSNVQTTGAVVAFNATNSILIPVGNTAQRPGTPSTGMLRYNSTISQTEVWNGAAWVAVGGSSYTVIANEQFNGDGTTTTFTLSSTQTTDSCIVTINGIVQIPTTAYSVSGTTLTFTEAPMTGDTIDVREITTTTTVTAISNSSGNAIVSVSETVGEVDITGNLVAQLNSAAPTLGVNSTMSFQLVSDTSLKVLVRGTDGTTRSVTLTLA